MKLELVPIEGERVLTKEEKERLRSRTLPIPPAAIEAFTDDEVEEIKGFLANFIILNEQLHHDKAQEDDSGHYERSIKRLEAKAQAMFQDLSPGLARFIELLDLFPREPWREIESLLEHMCQDYFWYKRGVKRDTGIEAAFDNPFLLAQDDCIEEDDMELQLQLQCRIAPEDVKVMISHFTLQDLVKQIIRSRKCIIGGFWGDEHFDV